VSTPDDPTVIESSDDEEAQPATPRRARPLGLDAVQRYLPIVAIVGMVATYLQVPNAYLALTLIAAVWLIATRIASSRRFLGLTLTEGLAWDATVLICIGLVFNVLAAAQPPA
jgi:hypothetical protein